MRRPCVLGALLALLLLAGCGFTPQGAAVRRALAEGTARAGDTGLENAEWFLCEAAPVGAVKRRYGADGDMASAYAKLCDRAASAGIVAPVTGPE
ncbi:MAG: hypothetical protein IH904_06400 [Proteobacteria bacterium]|nr:hypothetical protein [Pseudomonadota bacterium]